MMKLSRTLNVGTFNKVKYRMKKVLLKLLPKRIRKPVKLLFAILGVWLYLLMMINLSGSIYLLQAKNIIITIITYASDQTSPVAVTAIIVLAMVILLHRYLLSIPTGEQKNSSYKKSIYYEVNSIIGFLYVLITIGAVLPFMLPLFS